MALHSHARGSNPCNTPLAVVSATDVVTSGDEKMKAGTTVISLVKTIAVVVVVAVSTPAYAQWIMAARHVAGRISQMTQDDQNGQPAYHFATVILDAPASNVFATVVRVAASNNAVTIVSRDDANFRIKFAEGTKSASLNVVPLSDDTSQLLIAATASSSASDPGTSRVVSSIMRICAEMNKTCTVSGQ